MMRKIIKEIFLAHKILFTFSIISIFLLVTFIVFQYFGFSGLLLDVKWIIVAGFPILVGLFIAGYIKTFKGFGIELEASLKAEIPSTIISGINDSNIVDKLGLDKQSLFYIQDLDEASRLSISRIRLVMGRRGYYDTHVIRQYFSLLRNLKYVEVVNSKGEFQFLIPIEYFKIQGDLNFINIDFLVSQLEKGILDSGFPGSIHEFVNSDDSLLQAYRKLLRSNTSIFLAFGDKNLPVLDSYKKVIGLLSKIKVEEFISKEVLESYEEKNRS